MNENLYEKIIDKVVESGYIVIEDAIKSEDISSLFSLVQESRAFKKAGISASSNQHIDESRRRDKIVWLDEDGGVQSKYLAFTRGLQKMLNRELYLGLSYYEAHFALYEKGDFYEKHLDSFRGSKNRVVTTVLYLNDEHKVSDGGELVIYDMNDKEIERVVPKGGTLVVFLSDRFPHEVLESQTKRYSIAGWFRVDR